MTEDSLRYKIGKVVFGTLKHKVSQFVTMFGVLLMLNWPTHKSNGWSFWVGTLFLILNIIGNYAQGWDRGSESTKKLLLSMLNEKTEEIKAKRAKAKAAKK